MIRPNGPLWEERKVNASASALAIVETDGRPAMLSIRAELHCKCPAVFVT
jgi:hypothetical protein